MAWKQIQGTGRGTSYWTCHFNPSFILYQRRWIRRERRRGQLNGNKFVGYETWQMESKRLSFSPPLYHSGEVPLQNFQLFFLSSPLFLSTNLICWLPTFGFSEIIFQPVNLRTWLVFWTVPRCSNLLMHQTFSPSANLWNTVLQFFCLLPMATSSCSASFSFPNSLVTESCLFCRWT